MYVAEDKVDEVYQKIKFQMRSCDCLNFLALIA